MKDVITHKNYVGSVHFSPEDETFFGRIEGIDDLISFEGTTVSELKKSFEEAVDDYIEICQRENRPSEKSFKGSFNVRLNPDLHKKAFRIAMIEGKTLNQFVLQAVEHEISQKMVN